MQLDGLQLAFRQRCFCYVFSLMTSLCCVQHCDVGANYVAAMQTHVMQLVHVHVCTGVCGCA